MPISFYALITPLRGGGGGDERPDQGLPGQPGQPPRPDQGLPPFPAHPIVIPPDAIGPGVPTHPIFIPPIAELPGFPTPPIYIPPDAIAPGVPSQPIYWPPHPDQGLPIGPDQGLPQPPAGGGGGGAGGAPDNSLPGSQPGIDNSLPPIQWPSLPEQIPDEAEAVVLVKTRGAEASWYFVMDDGSLQPIDGGSSGGSQQSGQRRKAGQAKK